MERNSEKRISRGRSVCRKTGKSTASVCRRRLAPVDYRRREKKRLRLRAAVTQSLQYKEKSGTRAGKETKKRPRGIVPQGSAFP